MQPESRDEIATAIERLTGESINLNDQAIKGRNIWGRVAFNQTGMVHIEIMPRDMVVTEAAMSSISKDDMLLGRAQRRASYQKRCREQAVLMNSQAIKNSGLVLFVSSNGYLTKKVKLLIEALL